MRPITELKRALDSLYAKTQKESGRRSQNFHRDPVFLIRGKGDRGFQEGFGLLAALYSIGNVSAFLPPLERIGRHILETGWIPFLAGRASLKLFSPLYNYRFYEKRDIQVVLKILSAIYVKKKLTIERLLLETEGTNLAERLIAALEKERRSLRLPESRFIFKSSSSKRIWMYLRWMIRKDAFDPGIWSSFKPSELLMPLDTHAFWFARALGLTARKSPGPAAQIEITRNLRVLMPRDPVRYDFALTQLAIMGHCRKKLTPFCENCPVRGSCRIYQNIELSAKPELAELAGASEASGD